MKSYWPEVTQYNEYKAIQLARQILAACEEPDLVNSVPYPVGWKDIDSEGTLKMLKRFCLSEDQEKTYCVHRLLVLRNLTNSYWLTDGVVYLKAWFQAFKCEFHHDQIATG